MKVVGLLSGGKDSCFNLVHCVQNGHEVIALASLSPPTGKEEIDSYMYQTVGQDAIEVVAAALDLPLVRRVIVGTAVEQGSEYGKRSTLGSVTGDETEDMYELLFSVKEKYPEVEAVSVGAILSSYQRNSLYGAHICGEGGEYETLTLDCPLFKSSIVLLETEPVVQDESNAGMVAYLRIKQARLEAKEPTNGHVVVPPTLDDRYVRISDSVAQKTGMYITEGFPPTTHPSTTEVHTRRGGRWVGVSGVKCRSEVTGGQDLEEEVRGCFLQLQGESTQLAKGGPPTRACIAVDLPPGTRVIMDCIAYAEGTPHDRQALHVQGISYWAAANIGPYSQAVAVGGELFVSGQIGLIPAQMQLPSPPNLGMESALAFQHLDRITTLTKANSGRDWSPIAQSAIIWTESAEHFDGARAAWAKYSEESQYHIPSLFVACKTIPKSGMIEVQMLQHTGLASLKDQETGMFEDKRVVPEVGVVRGENWLLSTVRTEDICLALLTVRGGVTTSPSFPQSLAELKEKSVSIRLFYTSDSASLNFLNTFLAGYPRSPVPCRALGSQDEGWDAALLIFAAFDDKEAG
ncbi:hypothetical protein FRC05_008228 [Tulasnella sp. 425]|nr:hypothetical protein FRC05_008228 [Tulasnella sp. 425]